MASNSPDTSSSNSINDDAEIGPNEVDENVDEEDTSESELEIKSREYIAIVNDLMMLCCENSDLDSARRLKEAALSNVEKFDELIARLEGEDQGSPTQEVVDSLFEEAAGSPIQEELVYSRIEEINFRQEVNNYQTQTQTVMFAPPRSMAQSFFQPFNSPYDDVAAYNYSYNSPQFVPTYRLTPQSYTYASVPPSQPVPLMSIPTRPPYTHSPYPIGYSDWRMNRPPQYYTASPIPVHTPPPPPHTYVDCSYQVPPRMRQSSFKIWESPVPRRPKSSKRTFHPSKAGDDEPRNDGEAEKENIQPPQQVVIVTRCDCRKKTMDDKLTQTSPEKVKVEPSHQVDFVPLQDGSSDLMEKSTSSVESHSPEPVSPTTTRLVSSRSGSEPLTQPPICIKLTDEKEFPPLDAIPVERVSKGQNAFSVVAMTVKTETQKPETPSLAVKPETPPLVVKPETPPLAVKPETPPLAVKPENPSLPVKKGGQMSKVPKKKTYFDREHRSGYLVKIMERFCINVDKIFSEGEAKKTVVYSNKSVDSTQPKPTRTQDKRVAEGWHLVTARGSSYRRSMVIEPSSKPSTSVSTYFPEPEFEPPSAAEAFFQQYVDYLDNLASSEQDEELDKFERTNQREETPPVLYPDTCCVASFEAFIIEHPQEAETFQKDLGNKLKQFRWSETKQKLAQQKRKQIVECKTAKARDMIQKVQEVKAAKTRLALERKTQIFEKLKKAEEKRNKYLSYIRKKAHNEEEKLKEIAFINELEAQNRRHDSLALRQEHEERLQCILEERQRRIEEKAAKEAAAEERRRAIETERQEKMQKIAEERKLKEEKIGEQQEKRLVLAKEKARKRDDKMSSIKTQTSEKTKQLKARIFRKLEDAAERHDLDIEQKRMKASASGVHKLEDSPVSDDAPRSTPSEHDIKLPTGLQKREFRKLKLKISKKSAYYMKTLSSSPMEPLPKDLQLLLSKMMKQTPILSRLDLIQKFLEKLETAIDENSGNLLFDAATDVSSIIMEIAVATSTQPTVEALTVNVKCSFIISKIFAANVRNVTHFINSNQLQHVVAALLNLFDICTDEKELRLKGLVGNVTILTAVHLVLRDEEENLENVRNRQNIISVVEFLNYVLSYGLIGRMMLAHREDIANYTKEVLTLLHSCFHRFYRIFVLEAGHYKEAAACIKQTDCFNCVRFLYEFVQQHDLTSSEAADCLPSSHAIKLAMVLELAQNNFELFKEMMSLDGAALQLRAVISSLLTYAKNADDTNLYVCLLKAVGFFALCSRDYKVLLQSGNQPTVLNQLVDCGFELFAIHLKHLFIALYVLGQEVKTNRDIINQEFSFTSIEMYIRTKMEAKDTLSVMAKQHLTRNPEDIQVINVLDYD